MTAPAVARRAETFPGFTLPAIDGSSVFLESYRGRSNLVVVFAADMTGESPVTALLERLLARTEELTVEAAQVIVIATSLHTGPQRGPWAFPTLVDGGGDIHRTLGATDAGGRPAPAVFVLTGSARSSPPTCQGTARHGQARKRFSTGSCSSTSSVRNSAGVADLVERRIG